MNRRDFLGCVITLPFIPVLGEEPNVIPYRISIKVNGRYIAGPDVIAAYRDEMKQLTHFCSGVLRIKEPTHITSVLWLNKNLRVIHSYNANMRLSNGNEFRCCYNVPDKETYETSPYEALSSR